MNKQNDGQTREKINFFSRQHGVDEQALEKNDDERQSVDSGQRNQLDKKEVLVLGITEESPGEAGKEVSQDVFEGHPDKRGKQENRIRKATSDFCEYKRKKRPKQRQIEHEDDVDHNTEANGEIPVVSRDIRDPVEKNSIEGKSCDHSQDKRLSRRFLRENVEKGNERYPAQERKAEFREGERCQQTAQEGQQDIRCFYLQIISV